MPADEADAAGGAAAQRPRRNEGTFADEFLAVLRADFSAHGRTAVAQCREKDPTTYVKLVASLLPKATQDEPDELSDEERKRRIRALIDMLGFGTGAARAADAARN